MDSELFWKLLEPVHAKAASFCVKLAGDRHEGEDLYQDALLAAMTRFHTLKDRTAFRPWLFQIVVNRYKNRYRSRRRRHLLLAMQITEAVAGEDPSSRNASRRQLQKLLSALPAPDRALVVLHEIEGWSVRELAAMLKKPEGTVKTRLFRARTRMRRMLERHSRQLKAKKSLEVKYAVQRCQAVDNTE